ncbi:hypothetical protein D3C87_1224880 [compost metagenome]
MPGLAKLAWDLLIVFPTAVTVTRLLVQFQQCFSLFHLSAKFFRAGTEQHPAQLFQLRAQMFYFPLFVFYLFFCTGQRRAQEELSLIHEAEFDIFLSELFFKCCDAGEIIVFHDHCYNVVMVFLQHCQ